MVLTFKQWNLSSLLQFIQDPKGNQSDDALAIRWVLPNFDTIILCVVPRSIKDFASSLSDALARKFERYWINLKGFLSALVLFFEARSQT
jgi:hypothetical protein